MSLDATWVMLGSGERALRGPVADAGGALSRIACRATIGFDERLAHLIEAGADMFLMPSRFEPCGLNQLYSLRYGTVPIVRATGGLDDTVQDYDPAAGRAPASSSRTIRPERWSRPSGGPLATFQDREPGGRSSGPACGGPSPGTLRPGSMSKCIEPAAGSPMGIAECSQWVNKGQAREFARTEDTTWHLRRSRP